MLHASETWQLIKWKLTSVLAAQSHQGYRLTIGSHQSKKDDKGQETIQSSTTPYPGYHMKKYPVTKIQ